MQIASVCRRVDVLLFQHRAVASFLDACVRFIVILRDPLSALGHFKLLRVAPIRKLPLEEFTELRHRLLP